MTDDDTQYLAADPPEVEEEPVHWDTPENRAAVRRIADKLFVDIQRAVVSGSTHDRKTVERGQVSLNHAIRMSEQDSRHRRFGPFRSK